MAVAPKPMKTLPAIPARPGGASLSSRPEICVMRAINGWVVFDASPSNMLRHPVMVAESPAKLAEIVTGWATMQESGGRA